MAWCDAGARCPVAEVPVVGDDALRVRRRRRRSVEARGHAVGLDREVRRRARRGRWILVDGDRSGRGVRRTSVVGHGERHLVRARSGVEMPRLDSGSVRVVAEVPCVVDQRAVRIARERGIERNEVGRGGRGELADGCLIGGDRVDGSSGNGTGPVVVRDDMTDLVAARRRVLVGGARPRRTGAVTEVPPMRDDHAVEIERS